MASQKRQRWSAKVMRTSNALDLEPGIFSASDPTEIALSLKRSAEQSRRRKATAYQSAMSMLNFYINRAGKNLPASRKATLNRAKMELRKIFGRAPPEAYDFTAEECDSLFDRDTLGKIAGLIDIGSFQNGDLISKKLQHRRDKKWQQRLAHDRSA